MSYQLFNFSKGFGMVPYKTIFSSHFAFHKSVYWKFLFSPMISRLCFFSSSVTAFDVLTCCLFFSLQKHFHWSGLGNSSKYWSSSIIKWHISHFIWLSIILWNHDPINQLDNLLLARLGRFNGYHIGLSGKVFLHRYPNSFYLWLLHIIRHWLTSQKTNKQKKTLDLFSIAMILFYLIL